MAQLQKGQKEKSVRKVTRWALHDSTQFKETIIRLTSFVDGLYQVTTALGLLQTYYEALRLHEEINTVENEEHLELLAEATSKRTGSSIHQTVSDAASRRLLVLAASVYEGDLDPDISSQRHSNASTYFFHTAKTKPSEHALEPVAEEENEDSESGENPTGIPPLGPRFSSVLSTRSCAECEDASLQCSTLEKSVSYNKCAELHLECSFDLGGSIMSSAFGTPDNRSSSALRSTPQHEHLLTEAATRSKAAPKLLSFEAGDGHYGERMAAINDSNLYHWIDRSASLVYQAHRSNSAAKRMFHELKIIRKAKVSFISATPVADDLGRILASIEGPPETPYEGGIFLDFGLCLAKLAVEGARHTIPHENISPKY
jgi:hypothetical protein